MLPGLEPVLDSSSDDEIEERFAVLIRQTVESRRASGSRREIQRRKSIPRDRIAANELLMRDYFNEDHLYGDDSFKERFRISKNLCVRIANDLSARYEFTQHRSDARGKSGFTTLQKGTAVLRQLRYGTSADSNNDYLKMSTRTALECVYLFWEYVIKVYEKIYLWNPMKNDVEKLYATHLAKHGLPGMLGSLDCTHWKWKNCPNAWRGQFTRGDHDGPTVILEAVASRDLWFWHSFFGMAGSCNDLNVLAESSLLKDILAGKVPDRLYIVNGNETSMVITLVTEYISLTPRL